MTVSLLPDRLSLLRFPREELEACSHVILKHIVFRAYSQSNRRTRDEPLFSYIDNSLEISIFGDHRAISVDFPKDLCPGLEVSKHIYRALQVDNDDTFNSSRICTIVEPLAKAGVSIFYMSTYQTDLLFVQEDRIALVFKTLSANGLHMAYDEDMNSTPPDTPIPDQHGFRRLPINSLEEEESLYEHSQEMRDHPSFRANHPVTRELSEHSLATPPGSQDSGSEGDDEQDGSSGSAVSMVTSHNGVKQLVPLDIYSAQRHGKGSGSTWSESFAGNESGYEETMLAKASPTTTTAFEVRQQADRTLPENSLRCVGLNTELEAGHQPWLLKIIKILFYHDRVKEEATLAGNGPTHDAPRFFSFTATSECVSMITDTYILEEFEEHELFMDMETCPLRLIQLDLHRFGLDKYGIIHSVARPLTEAGIDLLFLSTFSTANILVADHRLSEAERILSGSGSTTLGS
ncbi:hypothetical protein F5H01DRAFT_341412 [Linnemannia elongata]|nr:hypothetical protein F5H01DRAFT_341412 [Linnemannia elongata]